MSTENINEIPTRGIVINKCKLLSQHLNKKESVSTLRQDMDVLTNGKLDADEKVKIVSSKLSELQKEYEEEKTKSSKCKTFRYELRLYQMISKITWDVDSTAEEVKGCIQTKPPQTFQLDMKSNSNYFITNHLWNLASGDE